MDNIHAIQQLIEKTNECRKSLILTFVAHEKAFETVKYQSVLNALRHQGTSREHVDIFSNVYRKQ